MYRYPIIADAAKSKSRTSVSEHRNLVNDIEKMQSLHHLTQNNNITIPVDIFSASKDRSCLDPLKLELTKINLEIARLENRYHALQLYASCKNMSMNELSDRQSTITSVIEILKTIQAGMQNLSKMAFHPPSSGGQTYPHPMFMQVSTTPERQDLRSSEQMRATLRWL